jgi:glycosyltransferase involved in cell wall biosynthesis
MKTRDPRTVLGMPAYNRPDALPRVLESLLSQTCQDFALVIVDDAPSARIREIVDSYAGYGAPITYEANPVRLGMIGNWRKAFMRGRELYPNSEYFAWVSDHDIWHPRWLEVLLGVLDHKPEVVLAYPLMERVFATHRYPIRRRFDTTGVKSRIARLRAAVSSMTAGNCIYGLIRSRALEQAGIFTAVLAPDRHLLMQLLLLGEFSHVPQVLWHREVAGVFSYKRQRRMFFPAHIPIYTYLPMTVQHFGVMLWSFGVRSGGRPLFGRLKGITYAFAYFWYANKRELLRDDARWRLGLQRTAIGKWLFKRVSQQRRDVSSGKRKAAAA